MSLIGSLTIRLVSEQPEHPKTWPIKRDAQEQKMDVGSILTTARSVLGNRLVWQVGLAHATAFLARTSDRVLGSFFQDVTGLSRPLCGALSASVTVGFVLGLAKGQAYHKLPDTNSKALMLKRAYLSSVLSALGLALTANPLITDLLNPSKAGLALAVSLLSGVMASSLSFQFYQIPQMVASTFGNDKAVCLSFVDALGFLLSAPIWAATAKIVGTPSGWTKAWVMLASLFGAGGMLMMKTFPEVQQRQAQV